MEHSCKHINWQGKRILLLLLTAALLLALAGCRSTPAAEPTEDTTLPTETALPTEDTTPTEPQIRTLEDVSVEVPMFPGETTEYIHTLELKQLFAEGGTFTVESDNPGTTAQQKGDKLLITVTEAVEQVIAVTNGKETISFTLKPTPVIGNQLMNGDFEQDYLGWRLSDEEKAAYTIYDSPVDIWNNPVGATGKYLYGFTDEAYDKAAFHSSLFKLGGSGVITWKMAGNCSKDLRFVLMQYNEGGEDVQIAEFNNWYYKGSNESGFIFRQYYYQVDMEKYADSTCYFLVEDHNTGADGFGFVNLDDIVTYYETVPETKGMLEAGFCVRPQKPAAPLPPEPVWSVGKDVPNQLVNGDFEQGYQNWYLSAQEKGAYTIEISPTDIWGNPVGATGKYLYGFTDEAYDKAEFRSGAFKLAGSGIITWKMAGNCTDNLQFILMKYNEGGTDEPIAVFNNWFYAGSNQSGFIFRPYYYQVDMEKYADSICYFLVKDGSTGDQGFGFVNLDDIVTYYETAPDTSAMLPGGFCADPTPPPEPPVVTNPYQLPNGDFESGHANWNMTDEEKAAYTVYNSPTDIWGNPVGASGNYLYGYANEAFASASFTSSTFQVGGSGVITWKMAGNCTPDLQFILMKKGTDGAADEQIAVFNNWYFGTVAESGFIFRDYYYQIDLEKYAGAECYFRVVDNAVANFAFICLDDIVTYYETAPDVSGKLPGGFGSDPTPKPPVVEIPYQLPNGDFESGHASWNMTDEEKAAYSIYGSPTDIWGNPVGASGNYLYGFANEAFANASFTSSTFQVGGSGVITWKMAGNCSDKLQFALMKKGTDGAADEAIAVFNNWYFGTVAESGFIFHDYYYQIDLAKHAGAECYFLVIDQDDGSAGFGFICLDDIVTYYETAPDVSGKLPGGFVAKPTPSAPAVPYQMPNGDFESGYAGWNLTDEEKAAYTIYNSPTDIWGNPVGANGNYLYGFANEAFAGANFTSPTFTAGGSGVITWKMAGNCTADLQFALVRCNPGGDDEVVATFNNWYFGTVAESGFIFHSYYYQLDMSKYEGQQFYFVVSDSAVANFAFICLDDIVTYYETAPDLSGYLKGGYCTAPEA